jgi:hypothetical protein
MELTKRDAAPAICYREAVSTHSIGCLFNDKGRLTDTNPITDI